jgi:hypothetical protein
MAARLIVADSLLFFRHYARLAFPTWQQGSMMDNPPEKKLQIRYLRKSLSSNRTFNSSRPLGCMYMENVHLCTL